MKKNKSIIDQAETLFSQANEAQAHEEYAQSAQLYTKILDLIPNNSQVLYQLGRVKHLQGETRESISILTMAHQLEPKNAEICFSLGVALSKLGDEHTALSYYNKALELNPHLISAWINAARSYISLSDHNSAIRCYEKAISINPQSIPALLSLGILTKIRDPDVAIEKLKKVAALDPYCKDAHYQLASIYSGRLRQEDANRSLKSALELDGYPAHVHSAYLFSLLYQNVLDPDFIFSEHLAWADINKSQQPAYYRNTRDISRKINLGFVSTDFVFHPVMSFFTPIAKNIDRSRFSIFCYSNVELPDNYTAIVKPLADGWRDIRGMRDDAVCRKIATDEIDILFDLGGHTAANRLGVFTRKPAPLQISYIGYPFTTGLKTIDYRITDNIADPIGATEQYYTETLIRLPHSFLCYMGVTIPIKKAPPSIQRGYITFGCFNNYLKLSPHSLQLWATLLHSVPRSRLLLKSSTANFTDAKAILLARFLALGIDESKITFSEHVPDASKHLDKYNGVDIALDTYPYNGTTTTCEALWMGVPVVTYAGNIHVSRVGASLLTSAGLTHLIANTDEEFLSICKRLTVDHAALSEYRSTLRTHLLNTPLGNPSVYIKNFQHELESVWQEWCSRTANEVVEQETSNSDATEYSPKSVLFSNTISLRMPGDIAIIVPNDINNLTTYSILEQDDWFEVELDFLRNAITRGQCAADIGAYLGVYALTLAHLCGDSGVVWVASEKGDAHNMLEKSIAANKFDNIRMIDRLPSTDATFDMLVKTHAIGPLDFIRIDPALDIPRFFSGAADYFKNNSPLIMVNIKTPHGYDMTRVEMLTKTGYQAYRIVPGLQCIAPFQANSALESTSIVIFFAKPDRAYALNSAGRLALQPAGSNNPESNIDTHWQDVMRNWPYAKKLFPHWSKYTRRSPSPHWEMYETIINLHFSAHIGKHPINLRYEMLSRAMILGAELINKHANIPRLMTLTRICFDLDFRSLALNLLQNINNILRQGAEIEFNEPFIPLRKRFELLESSVNMEKFCRANVLEQWTIGSCHTGYAAPPNHSAPLTYERTLGFDHPSLERRRILEHYLHRNSLALVPTTMLTTPSPSNINSEFWRAISEKKLILGNSK
ncbi:MAG: tetratricopeptide repeat protein [Pseudomonadota bacterium]